MRRATAAALLATLVPAAAAALEVVFVAPAAGVAVFGEIQVALEVRGGEGARVDLFLDGQRVASAERPPWRFRVATGEENVERRLRAVARVPGGPTAEATLVLPALRVDEVVELELQQLYVTATHDGEPILDLGRGDFRLDDDGDRQRIVTFERGEVPITAVLLLDASLSMRGDPLAGALAGARAFVDGLAELDEARVVLFSDRTLSRTPFGRDPESLLAGLGGASAHGGSAVNDHLYLALAELERRQGRRVVVLLSDGVDLDSVLGVTELEPVIGRSPVLFYWLRLGDARGVLRRRSVWRDFDEHQRELEALERLVERSGGRIFDLPPGTDPRGPFREILAELRSQYVLGWYPNAPQNDGSWRKLRLDVARPGVRLRAREGYYDD
jgi:Ca-activated chloride channel family protein